MEQLKDLFEQNPTLWTVTLWAGVFLAAWLANFLAKRVILRAVRALVGRTKMTWDDALVEHGVFEKWSHLAPALVFYSAAPFLFSGEGQEEWVKRLATVWMVLAGARAASAFLEALVTIGKQRKSTKGKPIRSYIQVLKILMWLAVGIITVARLMGESPVALLTGLGAMTAIILLVFKDSILGFVASIQIASNDMVRAGDWIEMPKYDADGDVLEISLNTVKVQNWDKTITTIPTYAFMTDSFKNWRGMTESGGRRIKRSIALDMTSVKFLEPDDLARLQQVQALRPYLDEKTETLATWNEDQGIDDASRVNGRRLTNLGTFRAYLETYLKEHGDIRKDMTFLVRQLSPGPEGLPIEIYVFSGEQRWAPYEAIIGDIFDHLLAVIPEFDLRVYQKPSGADLRMLESIGG